MSYSAYQTASAVDPFQPTLEMCLRGHRQGVCAVGFQPSLTQTSHMPRVVSGGADGAVMLWDGAATTRAVRYVGHRGPVFAAAASPRANLLASTGHDGYVRLWIPNARRTAATYGLHAETATADRNTCGWRGHAGAARALAFAQDGSDHIYTAGDDKTVKCWDLNYASSSHHIGTGPGNKFVGCFAAPSSPSSSASSATAPMRHRSTVHTNWVRALAVQSAYTSATFSHYVASGGDDQAIVVWDARTRAPAHVLYDCTASVHALRFHPDGRQLVSGDSSGAVHVFDLRHTSAPAAARVSSSLVQRYSAAHVRGVQSVDVAPNGGWLLSTGNDGTAKLWDLREALLYCTVEGHEGAVKACGFSGDGRWFVTAGGEDKTVLAWRSGLAAATAQGAPSQRATSPAAADVAGDALNGCDRQPRRSKLQGGGGLAHHRDPFVPTEAVANTAASSSVAEEARAGPSRGRSNGNCAPHAPVAAPTVIGAGAATLGRPPLSPAPTTRTADTDEELGCSAALDEANSSEARARSFERDEAHRYSHLAAASGDASGRVKLPVVPRETAASARVAALPRASAESPSVVDGDVRSLVVAAEEREQAALVAQERAYQRLQEDRITQQRLSNLEDALASLAGYMQAQQAAQTRDMHDARAATTAQVAKFGADLAELKSMLAQLTQHTAAEASG